MEDIARHLVIGYGEVGRGIKAVLDSKFEVGVYERGDKPLGHYDIIHICFPFSKFFCREVWRYMKLWEPMVAIVHSTVPVGTMDKLKSKKIVYSPVRGKHPELAEGIKTFVKYFAGKGDAIDIAMTTFQYAGVSVTRANSYKDLEAAKLLDTTAYGWNIVFMKAVRKFCRDNNLDFDTVYTSFTESYNAGYSLMGYPEFVRPVLKPMDGPIGGHCIIPNAKILKNHFKPARILLSLNRKYQ